MMSASLMIWLSLVAASAGSERDPAKALESYQGAKDQTSRDADSQVRLALWCDAHGLRAEHLKHLALALITDPNHIAARGLLGFVSYQGRWQRAEDVTNTVEADPKLAAALEAYRARRATIRDRPDDHWALAIWCEQNGLIPESRAHLTTVTRLDPAREAAWKRLGYRRIRGRWVSQKQYEAEVAEREARSKAERHWSASLRRWRSRLENHSHREETETSLGAVTDPYAVAPILDVFGRGGPSDQRRAVQLLGQIDAPSATRALALLCVASPSPDVRRAACETLARRDAREAIRLLVGLLQDPEPHPNSVFFRIQSVPVGALGIGSPGFTSVVNRAGRWLRVYTVDEAFRPQISPPSSGYVDRVLAINSIQATELETIAKSLIEETLTEILPGRARIRKFDDRLIEDLKRITGEDHGDDWEAWKRWWIEDQGYAYESSQYRTPLESPMSPDGPTEITRLHYSCFAEGTLVRTISGPMPIESIRIGDRVLGQDVSTGELEFAPVRAVFHNKPAATLRIDIDGESIVATGIHRFWKVGRGWVMARDLKSGDEVRILGGVARVRSASVAPVQPVFNLEVGESQSFFVGRSAALVHDNSPVLPVLRAFDSIPEFAEIGTTRRQLED